MTDDNWGDFGDNAVEEGFSISGDGVTSDDLGGGSLDRPGSYHFEITEVVPELEVVGTSGKDKSPAVRFEMTVLQSVKGQCPEGTRYFHRLYVGGKGGQPIKEGSKKAIFRFCLGLGLAKEVEGKGIFDASTGGEINLDTLKRARGLQCCALIKKEVDDDYGEQFRIPFSDVRLPNDPKFEDTPKNFDALVAGGYAGPREAAQNLPKPPAPAAAAKPNEEAAGTQAQANDPFAGL